MASSPRGTSFVFDDAQIAVRVPRQPHSLAIFNFLSLYRQSPGIALAASSAGANATDAGQRSVVDDWYSPDLRFTLLSTSEDARVNSIAFKVVNIKTGDPDPAVFQIPEGYMVKDQYCRASGAITIHPSSSVSILKG